MEELVHLPLVVLVLASLSLLRYALHCFAGSGNQASRPGEPGTRPAGPGNQARLGQPGRAKPHSKNTQKAVERFLVMTKHANDHRGTSSHVGQKHANGLTKLSNGCQDMCRAQHDRTVVFGC